MRLSLLLLVLCALGKSPLAQSSPGCVLEIPVGVMTSDGALVRGLQASSFAVEETKVPAVVSDAVYDSEPRRIVFVLDRSSHLGEPATKIITAVLERILLNARPGDSFGLVFAGYEPVAIGKPEVVLAGFREMLAGRVPHSKKGSLLDALSEAAGLFHAPQLGDSIFAFAGVDDLDERAKYRRVHELLSERGIRVFGVLFGLLAGGTMKSSFATISAQQVYRSIYLYRTKLIQLYSPQSKTFIALTWGTGGFLTQEVTRDERHQYKLTETRLKELAEQEWQTYGAIAQIYRVRVSLSSPLSKPKPWKLDLAPELRNQPPEKYVLYPRQIPACGTQPNSK